MTSFDDLFNEIRIESYFALKKELGKNHNAKKFIESLIKQLAEKLKTSEETITSILLSDWVLDNYAYLNKVKEYPEKNQTDDKGFKKIVVAMKSREQ